MGSRIYIAPEILNGSAYDGEKVDIFSTGVVLYVMISGKYPFEMADPRDKKYKLIIDKKYSQFWKISEKYAYFSPLCRDLLERMFEYNPENRITLIEIS